MAPSYTEQPVRCCGHRTGGEDDTTNRQQRDRPQIETKLAPAHGDARRVDQRLAPAFRSYHLYRIVPVPA